MVLLDRVAESFVQLPPGSDACTAASSSDPDVRRAPGWPAPLRLASTGANRTYGEARERRHSVDSPAAPRAGRTPERAVGSTVSRRRGTTRGLHVGAGVPVVLPSNEPSTARTVTGRSW